MHEPPSTIYQYVDDQTSSNDLSLVVDLPMMNIETICWRTSLTLHLSQRGKPEATLFHQLHNVLCEKNTFIEYPHSARKVFMLQHSNGMLSSHKLIIRKYFLGASILYIYIIIYIYLFIYFGVFGIICRVFRSMLELIWGKIPNIPVKIA